MSLISPAGPLILPHSYYSPSFSAFKATRSLFICKCQREAQAIVTSCSFSPLFSISRLFLCLSARYCRQAAKPELYTRSGLMSGFGTFSHIYQDEPADPLPLQPFSLIQFVVSSFRGIRSNWLRLKLTLSLETQTSNFTFDITGNGNFWKVMCGNNGHPGDLVDLRHLAASSAGDLFWHFFALYFCSATIKWKFRKKYCLVINNKYKIQASKPALRHFLSLHLFARPSNPLFSP